MKQAGHHFLGTPVMAAIGVSCVLALSGPAHAQGEKPAPYLSIELNAMQQVENACRIVFMADNRLGSDLTALSYETVLIDTNGTVSRLTLFDFQALPEGRPRVRQFDLDNTQCGDIGRILINGAAACTGDGLSGGECVDALRLTSRTNAEIVG